MLGTTLKQFCAFALTLGLSAPVSASLIGDTVSLTTNLGMDTGDVLVQDGVVELDPLNAEAPLLAIDWEESSIEVIISGDTNFGSVTWTFNSLDWVGAPDGVIVDIAFTTPSTGPIASFDDHSVSLQFIAQTFFNAGDVIRIDLITNHDVPIPTTLALFGLGLAGLGLRRGKQKKSA